MPRKIKTRIVVQMEREGAPYLRGEGPSALSWETGVPLQQGKSHEWIFEIEETFSSGEFKVLINDQTYELGDNHRLYPGASIRINPRFPN